MKNIFFKIWIFIFSLFVQALVAQNYPDGLSDGTLKIDSEKIPVKIFASTDLSSINDFANGSNNNVLEIVNQENFEKSNSNENLNQYLQQIINNYKSNGFQFLDKNFKPFDTEVNLENISNVKYFLKSDKKITANNSVTLETDYKIWDPSKGIKLGPVTLHFYSLMFIFAFGLGYILMTFIFKIDHVNEKYLEPLFTWTLIGTIFGARIGHVVFYQRELFYEDFWSVFLPISTKGGLHFTGFSGLASHGATIMLILTTLYYSFKIIKKNPLWVYDRLGIVVALGGAFVRIGNFFNSEIIGKPVAQDSPFAVLFPQMSDEYGFTVPRYPTQLFEAFGYFCLFILLWILYRYTNKKYQQGWLFGLFFIILWAIRFFVEYLKEPQGDEYFTIGNLNTGQTLSIPFMIAGLVIMIISSKFKITKEENQKPE